MSIENWSGRILYDVALAVERIGASRAAIDAVDPSAMLVGRHKNFRMLGMNLGDSIARAVAYSNAGADILFVPLILDHGAVAELLAAIAPKPVNVVVHRYDYTTRAFAEMGVRRCSVGASLAKAAWTGFDAAATSLRDLERQVSR